jgi:hypothetical protein
VVNNYNLHLDYVLPLTVVKSFSTTSSCLVGSIANNNLNLSFTFPSNVVQTFNTTTPGLVGVINNNVLTLNYTNTAVTSFSSSTPGLTGSITSNCLSLNYTPLITSVRSSTAGLTSTISNGVLDIEYTLPSSLVSSVRTTTQGMSCSILTMSCSVNYSPQPVDLSFSNQYSYTCLNVGQSGSGGVIKFGSIMQSGWLNQNFNYNNMITSNYNGDSSVFCVNCSQLWVPTNSYLDLKVTVNFAVSSVVTEQVYTTLKK